MFGERVRQLRQRSGLTQGELAGLASVSRQLVGAVEAGRHLPRVDAAAKLADALGTSVEFLLSPAPQQVASVTGAPVRQGVPLRLGRVGDRLVAAPAVSAGEGWDLADGVLGDDGLELLPGAVAGAVAVGCDPALGLGERLLAQRRAPRLMAVTASTADAVAALAGGSAHAGVVHGPPDGLPAPQAPVQRWHLARWRVGLAAPTDAPPGWWREALAGRCRVIQRASGAASQAAFEAAVSGAGGALPDGPIARGHVEAAAHARCDGLVAVTIEPAALSAGLWFHPLEAHVAELWVAEEHAGEAGVAALCELTSSDAFRRRVEAIGGYDLSGTGSRVTV